jgi:hypothetical protein
MQCHANHKINLVGFEVFTAVTIKNAFLWDVGPCRSCMNRRFGGTYSLHLQGRKIRERGTCVSRWLQPEEDILHKINLVVSFKIFSSANIIRVMNQGVDM